MPNDVSKKHMRCFVAVDLSPSAKDFLGRFMREEGSLFPSFRFGSPRNLHVTLQFLGDVERSRTSALAGDVSVAVRGLAPFHLELGEAVWFPRRGSPRGLHVSVGRGGEQLSTLAAKVRGALSAAGYPPDRPFEAHITLGRARNREVVQEQDVTSRWRASYAAFRERVGAPPPWEVGEILVMESILGPGGPTYIPRERVRLEGP